MIERGVFRFVNKMDPTSEPIVLSNIYFHLIRMTDGSVKRDAYVRNKQSVELRTNNQKIALPGGRHFLAFKDFQLELLQKRIVLDSCTITAIPTDTSKSSFNIFFRKLLLVGVDFGAMYRKNLIRADSVYCIEPMIHFVFDRPDTVKTREPKNRPDPEKIIRDLTGDLDLAFVGVKDAGIRIDINGRRHRSIYNSRKDDFSMRRLRISPDSAKPVTVQQFDLLVRDYRLFNQDSSTAFSFDSVHFSNTKIVLSNFAVVTTPSKFGAHNNRNFWIPHFELSGLDWYELIFEENLLAREATLYNPIINYRGIQRNTKHKKTNLFQILRSTDELLTLERINVIDGQLKVQLPSGASFSLQNANLSLQSNKLLASKNNEGLKQAIDVFSFNSGIIRIKDIEARLDSVQYTGKNLVSAKGLRVTNKDKSINANVSRLMMNNLLLDEKSQSMVIDGLSWQNATINLAKGKKANNGGGKGNIIIRNISGYNTALSYDDGNTKLNTDLQTIKATSFTQNERNSPVLEGLIANGKQLNFSNGSSNLTTSDYHIADKSSSYILKLKLEQSNGGDTLRISVPRTEFSVNINSLFQQNIDIAQMRLQSPDIFFSKWSQKKAKENTGSKNSNITIRQLSAIEPVIQTSIHKNDSVIRLNLPRSDEGVLTIQNLALHQKELSIGRLALKNESATFTKASGEVIGVEKGTVNVDIANIHLKPGPEKLNWSALLTSLTLENPNSFTTGKGNRFTFKQASLGNLQLSSNAITDIHKLAKLNVTAWVRTTTGQYTDSNTTIKWFNAGYDAKDKEMTLDSFVYHPTLSRDSFIAAAPFQTDYISFYSGPAKFTGFDLEQYNKDSVFQANTISFKRPQINIYRDKRAPFRGGIIKVLPTEMIKKIAQPVSINRINLVGGLLTYTELNPKTGKEGILALTELNASLGNIRNHNLLEHDSLALSADAMLMDSAQLSLRVKESYTDSLNSFLMTLRMKPTSSLSFLNPVLIPLSNIKITSGNIDSLHLRAIGNEYISLGEMNMFYRNLKIKLVKNGEETRSSVLRDFLSMLANTFIIKKNNKGESSIVFFERKRDRSFFNYIVKMTFSGMASSVGVKNNKKYYRKYKKEMEKSNLPPIRFEEAIEKSLENKTAGQEKGYKPSVKNGQ